MKGMNKMDLIVNTRGASIRKKGECFLVNVEEEKQEFSCKNVERILVTTSAMISSDALKLAIENNIDVVFLEYSGMPFARVWHSKLGSITTIRRNQLKLSEIDLGTIFVKEWILQKIDNQINNLKVLKSNRTGESVELLDKSINEMNIYKGKILNVADLPIKDVRGILEGYEGMCGRIYFNTLGSIIPAPFKFNGRSRNPSNDEFNCMLNYAYGILYSSVEKSCILAGLDPYIGIMHTDNYNKTALVFDLIEMYRGYMDMIVFSLFSKRMVQKSMFDKITGGGLWLNKEGKRLLIANINEKLEEKIKYKGRMIKLGNIIEYDCHRIANEILKRVS